MSRKSFMILEWLVLFPDILAAHKVFTLTQDLAPAMMVFLLMTLLWTYCGFFIWGRLHPDDTFVIPFFEDVDVRGCLMDDVVSSDLNECVFYMGEDTVSALGYIAVNETEYAVNVEGYVFIKQFRYDGSIVFNVCRREQGDYPVLFTVTASDPDVLTVSSIPSCLKDGSMERLLNEFSGVVLTDTAFRKC